MPQSPRDASSGLRLLLAAVTFSLGCNDYALGARHKEQALGPPSLEVSPDPIAIDHVINNCPTQPLTVSLTNAGDGTVHVSRVTITGDDAKAIYHEGHAVDLERGDSTSFLLSAWTTDEADDESTTDATLVVTSDDPERPEIDVPIVVTFDPVHVPDRKTLEDTFDFGDAQSRIDMLWVIDNSASMLDEIANLQDSFSVFIDTLNTGRVDYQLAVAGTDDRGRLLGDGTIVRSSSFTPADDFLALVPVAGTAKGLYEMGIQSAHDALEGSQSARDDLLRDDSRFVVVFVSDEDDQSALLESDFFPWLDALEPASRPPVINAIIGDPGTGCGLTNVDGAGGLPGDRYAGLVARTGGTWASICSPDYDAVLEGLANATEAPPTAFSITSVPEGYTLDPDTLEVTIDGATIDPSSTDGWTFEDATLTLVLHGKAQPVEGESVTIRYDAVEDPDGCPTVDPIGTGALYRAPSGCGCGHGSNRAAMVVGLGVMTFGWRGRRRSWPIKTTR